MIYLMKIIKSLIVTVAAVLFFADFTAGAQNVQLHYDFGRAIYGSGKDAPTAARGYLTSTVEMFRPDRFGSTFFFIDFDYSPKAQSAYWEISREFNFWQDALPQLSAHVEYNGGLNTSVSFDNAWLAGPAANFVSADFSRSLSLQLMYKYIPGNPVNEHNFQFSVVWNIDFLNSLFSFSGFADFWREGKTYLGTGYVFMSEPQIWFNLNALECIPDDVALSIGSEVELSNNFVAKGFFAIPTVALKWTF